MLAHYWLLLAAALALLCARGLLRRSAAALLRGRSRCWRLRVRRDGSLRTRGFRLRLYGVEIDDGSVEALATVRRLLDREPRWRVLSVDSDGTAAILLRSEGANVAEELLRQGAVRMRGSGARRLRAMQSQRLLRCDFPEDGAARGAIAREWMPPPFPWWQG